MTGGISVPRSALTDIVSAYVQRRGAGDNDKSQLLGVGYGVNFLVLPNATYGHLAIGSGYSFLLLILMFLLVALFVIFVVGASTIHFLILIDVYIHPRYSHFVSKCVIGFVVLCDIASFLIFILVAGAWPMQIFERLKGIQRLREKAPERVDEIYREMWRQYYQKPWLLRLFTRARLPDR
jgi:hypothetical protein